MKKYIALLLLFIPLRPLMAGSVKYNAYLANEAGLAYTKQYPLSLNGYMIDWASFQLIWSTANPVAVTFTDGSESTGTITVSNNTVLSTTSASDFLTVLTTQPVPSNATITVNGTPLYVNVHWFQDLVSSATTAVSIKQAIATYVTGVTASTSSFAIVRTTATQPGTGGNSMTLASNTSSITVNSANFTGGTDAACFSINNISLCANRDFVIGASSRTTAINIANAVNANTALAALITSTAPATCPGAAPGCGVVLSSADTVGANTNYAMVSSTPAALVLSNPTMTGGTNSAYTLVGSSATVIAASNAFSPSTGTINPTPMIALPVLYSTGSAQAITGLTWGTTYFVIPVTTGAFGLASTSTGAVAGTFLTLRSSQTKTTADSFTLTPLAYSGTAAGKWQASNDGVNWGDLPQLSSTTFTAVNPSSTTVLDCGQIDYSWIRFNVNAAPTTGGLQLQIIPNGKRNQ